MQIVMQKVVLDPISLLFADELERDPQLNALAEPELVTCAPAARITCL